ncbi:4-hydroxybenzoate polyprenyltransferase, mitochondrial-like [Oryzias melastigma]|uniref:4-hydroxybenzoate polyprenyltransferase, mitochondrial-like n=1 Tax=Oryzias melastigma TaxID=30732 RepID=UPI000CF828EC|nr:4-hydroxybenzoate polyprenyltransferase, mitochondrial-like [Oryzias melastigma]
MNAFHADEIDFDNEPHGSQVLTPACPHPPGKAAATQCNAKKASEPEPPRRDPLLQLVSLQKASGCWMLDAALASVLGKTSEELEKSKPEKVGH